MALEILDWLGGALSDVFVRLSSVPWWGLLFFFLPAVVFELPRYVIGNLWSALRDRARRDDGDRDAFAERLRGRSAPLVSIIVPGLNEAETIEHTVYSLSELDYPHKEIIVVDDGSNDGMDRVCRKLRKRFGIIYMCLRPRQGKSAAINAGIQLAKGEFVVTADADATYDRDALHKVLLPFADPRVGAVSGNVRVRNAARSIVTRIQAIEYLFSINMGRRLLARLNLLLIVSGAFGVFRKSVLKAVGGFAVGPGEDYDLTIRIHKAGYRVAFAPDAVCLTDAPHRLKALIRQRMRWEQSPVRFKLRGHADVFSPRLSHPATFLAFLESTFFEIGLLVLRFVYIAYLLVYHPVVVPLVLLVTWGFYMATDVVQYAIGISLSERRRMDLALLPCLPIFSLFNALYSVVRTVAYLDELFFQSSYHDRFVPPEVQREIQACKLAPRAARSGPLRRPAPGGGVGAAR
ncbi:MAG: glycosyltransferase [Planctomycetes bacterium]|nr:glycosyltransferase [Planctomycetota bacterium]